MEERSPKNKIQSANFARLSTEKVHEERLQDYNGALAESSKRLNDEIQLAVERGEFTCEVSPINVGIFSANTLATIIHILMKQGYEVTKGMNKLHISWK